MNCILPLGVPDGHHTTRIETAEVNEHHLHIIHIGICIYDNNLKPSYFIAHKIINCKFTPSSTNATNSVYAHTTSLNARTRNALYIHKLSMNTKCPSYSPNARLFEASQPYRIIPQQSL